MFKIIRNQTLFEIHLPHKGNQLSLIIIRIAWRNVVSMVASIFKSFVSSALNLAESQRIRSARGRGLNFGDLVISLLKAFNTYKSSSTS